MKSKFIKQSGVWLFCTAIFLGVANCGYKGDLYIAQPVQITAKDKEQNIPTNAEKAKEKTVENKPKNSANTINKSADKDKN